MSKPSDIDDGNGRVMRLNVQLTRDEYPELFDELKKFSKGIKRIQRLKTIANERLILAGQIRQKEIAEISTRSFESNSIGEDSDMMAAAIDAFGPTIK